MLEAIKKEIFLRKDVLHNKTLQSLYFGGGTPSILSVEEIQRLLDEILKFYTFSRDIEITLEANPDDLTPNFIRNLSKTAVNRLSIGTQSFFDGDLALMNRAHTASQAEDSIKRAQDYGFENLNIDLIYGTPTSGLETWKENLRKTVELAVPHISSYALTVEPKTTLSQWVSKNKIVRPNEELQNEEFYYMSYFLKDNGFSHYEISNFAKPGFYSRHNAAYWQHREYLGIGPSAHSYNGNNRRSWNIANNAMYIRNLQKDILPEESETLTDTEQFNEILMIGLRTNFGVDISELQARFSEKILQYFQEAISPKLEQGVLVVEENHLKIPEEFWFLADGIAADLFLI